MRTTSRQVARGALAAALLAGLPAVASVALAAAAGATGAVTLYVAASGAATSGCTSQGAGACSTLAQALAAMASYAGDAVTIDVGPGTAYQASVLGVDAGSLQSLTIDGTSGAASTLVTGAHSASAAFNISSGQVTISGLTIMGATEGAVFTYGTSQVELSDDRFDGDSDGDSATAGGAVFSTGRELTLLGDSFASDSASRSSGGAVFVDTQSFTSSGNAFLDDSASGAGGAIFDEALMSSSTGDTFTGDSAETGGAAAFVAGPSGGGISTTVSTRGDTFAGDSATGKPPAFGGVGGAVYTTTDLSSTSDTFSGDSASAGGGAIDAVEVVDPSVTLSSTDDTFFADSAPAGKGGAVLVDSGATAALSFDTIEGTSTAATDLATANSAPATPGTIAVSDSIVAQSACEASGGGAILDGGYNDESETSCGFTHGGSIDGSTTIGLAASLAANGAPATAPQTLDLGPLPAGQQGSAFELVPYATCVASGVASDERGDPRPGIPGEGCDAGALELQDLVQSSPTSARVLTGAGYAGQLTVGADAVGAVGYLASPASSAQLTVSPSGAIGAPGDTAPGTYVAFGTDSDTAGDLGTWSVVLTVDQAPAITSAPGASFTVGQPGSFTVTAGGAPPVTFSLSGAPGWISIGAASGVLAGTPPAGSAGTVAFSVLAANGVASPATQSFTLAVGEPAPAPTTITTTTTPATTTTTPATTRAPHVLAAQLRLRTSSASPSGTGLLALRLSCAGATCRGTARLEQHVTEHVAVKVRQAGKIVTRHEVRHLTRVLGTARYAIAAGATVVLRVHLDRTGIAVLQKAGRHVVVVSVVAGGTSIGRLRLSARRG